MQKCNQTIKYLKVLLKIRVNLNYTHAIAKASQFEKYFVKCVSNNVKSSSSKSVHTCILFIAPSTLGSPPLTVCITYGELQYATVQQAPSPITNDFKDVIIEFISSLKKAHKSIHRVRQGTQTPPPWMSGTLPNLRQHMLSQIGRYQHVHETSYC